VPSAGLFHQHQHQKKHTMNSNHDPRHPLVEVIKDMVYLSGKIDSFCIAFELARQRQRESPREAQRTGSMSTGAKEGI
jgi:hypothetical protein